MVLPCSSEHALDLWSLHWLALLALVASGIRVLSVRLAQQNRRLCLATKRTLAPVRWHTTKWCRIRDADGVGHAPTRPLCWLCLWCPRRDQERGSCRSYYGCVCEVVTRHAQLSPRGMDGTRTYKDVRETGRP